MIFDNRCCCFGLFSVFLPFRHLSFHYSQSVFYFSFGSFVCRLIFGKTYSYIKSLVLAIMTCNIPCTYFAAEESDVPIQDNHAYETTTLSVQ